MNIICLVLRHCVCLRAELFGGLSVESNLLLSVFSVWTKPEAAISSEAESDGAEKQSVTEAKRRSRQCAEKALSGPCRWFVVVVYWIVVNFSLQLIADIHRHVNIFLLNSFFVWWSTDSTCSSSPGSGPSSPNNSSQGNLCDNGLSAAVSSEVRRVWSVMFSKGQT